MLWLQRWNFIERARQERVLWDAFEQGADLDALVVTDTIPLSDDARKCSRIRQLSVADVMAETIRRICNEDSVSSLFIE